jgi:hypothetical protein
MSSVAHPAGTTARNAASLAALCRALGAQAGDLQNFDGGSALLRAARRHSVQPLLHRALLEDDVRLAAPAWAELQENVRRNALRNLWLSGELVRLVRRLAETGVTALPYKGPAMAAALWGSPDLRECVDLDLLVLPQHVARAAETLQHAGHEPLVKLSAAELAYHVRMAAELPFAGPALDGAGRLLLELQWRIVPRCFAVDMELEPMWPRLRRHQLAAENIAALAEEDLLLVLCVHGWKHAWGKLIWVADIAQLLATAELDFAAVLARARQLRIERMLLLGLALAQQEFGAELPQETANLIAGDRRVAQLASETMARHRSGTQLSYSQWQGYMLGARDAPRDRARQVWGFVFTPGLGEQRIARGFRPLYLPIRVARLSARAGRAIGRRIKS